MKFFRIRLGLIKFGFVSIGFKGRKDFILGKSRGLEIKIIWGIIVLNLGELRY